MAKEKPEQPRPRHDFGTFSTEDLRNMGTAIREELRSRRLARHSSNPQVGSQVRLIGGKHKGQTGTVRLNLGSSSSVVELEDGTTIRAGNERIEAFAAGRRKTG